MAPEETRWSQAFSEPTRKHLRWVALGLFVLVCIYGIATVALHMFFGAEYVENRLNDALASTGGSYEASIEGVRWSLLRQSVRAKQVTVHPDSQAQEQPQRESPASRLRVRATVPELRIQGIHLWALLWHQDLRLHTIAVHQPHLHVDATGSGDASEDETSQTEAPTRAEISVHAALARLLPGGEVRRLTLEEGRLSLNHRDASPHPSDSLWGLSVDIHDLVLDSTSARDTSRVLLSERISVGFDSLRHISSDSLYAFTVGPLQLSTQDSSLSIETPQFRPTVSDELFMRRQKYRANRFDTAARQITLDGVELRPFIEERAVLAESLHLDSLVVDVYRNNHLPAHPEAPLPKTMPHEAVRSLDRSLRIDTTRVTNGYAAYTLLHQDGSEPGRITFEDLWASIYNLTNDPRRMSPDQPAVIDAQTRVAGAGLLETTIRLPLLSPHLSLSYDGQLGPMDARAFNMAFVDLSGVRIESGEVDSLWFEADVQRGVATGSLQGSYRNLEIKMLNQESREQEFPDRLKTLVANEVVIESENTPNDSLRTGTIDHEYEEGKTFLKFLWHSVRSGLYSLIGL